MAEPIKKILIVEDDMIISLVVENMIKKLGHELVGKAASGEDAIKLAEEHKPDIILMDIRLKGDIDGIEAVIKIKDKIETAVIYLTGNSDKVNYDRAKATDCVDLISKPFTIGELTRSLDMIK
ncbi:response regulator [Rhodohalobacter sp.]|uniref:response regulator n=1 Tax=Rhodohalobacter sp. TaxID=1974210 RepID=UPI002ACD731F|nr:response regulator [Rhodohalobacter sp.]MDZ7756338.1 response regulator [Rhodohalobacter sp.]